MYPTSKSEPIQYTSDPPYCTGISEEGSVSVSIFLGMISLDEMEDIFHIP
jgi:hypothetical protein